MNLIKYSFHLFIILVFGILIGMSVRDCITEITSHTEHNIEVSSNKSSVVEASGFDPEGLNRLLDLRNEVITNGIYQYDLPEGDKLIIIKYENFLETELIQISRF